MVENDLISDLFYFHFFRVRHGLLRTGGRRLHAPWRLGREKAVFRAARTVRAPGHPGLVLWAAPRRRFSAHAGGCRRAGYRTSDPPRCRRGPADDRDPSRCPARVRTGNGFSLHVTPRSALFCRRTDHTASIVGIAPERAGAFKAARFRAPIVPLGACAAARPKGCCAALTSPLNRSGGSDPTKPRNPVRPRT